MKDGAGTFSQQEHSLAELTRPDCQHKEMVRAEKSNPKGRKRVHEPRDAVYHNWHVPFLWEQIVDAAKSLAVGKQMSATAIANVLKKKSPTMFSAISRNTIEGWIDHSGSQGYPNGGWQGVLVSI